MARTPTHVVSGQEMLREMRCVAERYRDACPHLRDFRATCRFVIHPSSTRLLGDIIAQEFKAKVGPSVRQTLSASELPQHPKYGPVIAEIHGIPLYSAHRIDSLFVFEHDPVDAETAALKYG